MSLRVDVYHHLVGGTGASAEVERTLHHILEKLETMTNQNAADLSAILDQIDASTTAIGQDIATLASEINTGLSQADVDSIKARLNTAATNLQTIDAETPNPSA